MISAPSSSSLFDFSDSALSFWKLHNMSRVTQEETQRSRNRAAVQRQEQADRANARFANRMLRFASLSYKRLRCGQRLGAGGRENGPRAASCDAEKTADFVRQREEEERRAAEADPLSRQRNVSFQ